MIRADDRVSSVLARDEKLVEVFTSVSPAFELLRKPRLRRTMARMVTISQAARIAGVEVDELLARLNAAAGDTPPPGAAPPPPKVAGPAVPAPDGLLETPPERIVDLDVREDLRAGREPLRRILEAVRTVGPEQVFRLRATFEPAPLYQVLGKQGFAHHTEQLGADDWRVWFFRGSPADRSTSPEATPDVSDLDGDIEVLDVRDLEPPEPMVRTLEALSRLPEGKTLVQINRRVPAFLLPKLEERGFSYEIREQSESLVRIFIQHKEQ